MTDFFHRVLDIATRRDPAYFQSHIDAHVARLVREENAHREAAAIQLLAEYEAEHGEITIEELQALEAEWIYPYGSDVPTELRIPELTNHPFRCGICGHRFTVEQWNERHHGAPNEDVHAACCEREGYCSGQHD